jgi:hypothetical protein
MPPIEDQRRASVTYARTSAFSELDHQLIGHPSPNVWPLPTSRPSCVRRDFSLLSGRERHSKRTAFQIWVPPGLDRSDGPRGPWQ